MPFLSASYVMGVPCSSVPLAMSTREPRSRSKRASTSAGTAKPATWPMWRGPLAYGHAGATRTVRRSVFVSGTGDDKGKLATRRVAEHGQYFRCASAQHLLVELGELARHRQLTLAQHLGDEGERLAHAVRRLESDRRPWVVRERGQQPAHLAWLARQVSEESEAGSPITGNRQRRGDRARPRNRHDGVSRGPSSFDQRLAGVGQRGRAGVADKGDITLSERRHHAGQAAPLDRRSIAEQRFSNAVTREQARCDPRVLSSDRVDLTQDPDRPRGDVFEVADRCGHDEEAAQSSNHSPTRSAISADGPTYLEAGGRTSRKAFP